MKFLLTSVAATFILTLLDMPQYAYGANWRCCSTSSCNTLPWASGCGVRLPRHLDVQNDVRMRPVALIGLPLAVCLEAIPKPEFWHGEC